MDLILSPVTGSLVARATSDDVEPTAGHLLVEIAKVCSKSPSAARSVGELLLNRVKKSSPFVKRKGLRVLKHLLLSNTVPAAELSALRECLLKKESDLRVCLTFSGAPHATLGMDPYTSVRSEATSVMDALYRTTAVVAHIVTQGTGSSDAVAQPAATAAAAATATAEGTGGSGGSGKLSSKAATRLVAAVFGSKQKEAVVEEQDDGSYTAPSAGASMFQGLDGADAASQPAVSAAGLVTGAGSSQSPSQPRSQFTRKMGSVAAPVPQSNAAAELLGDAPAAAPQKAAPPSTSPLDELLGIAPQQPTQQVKRNSVPQTGTSATELLLLGGFSSPQVQPHPQSQHQLFNDLDMAPAEHKPSSSSGFPFATAASTSPVPARTDKAPATTAQPSAFAFV